MAEAVRLTPREVVVLELLATVLTAGAIARRLAIAERTVQKHLQRVYAKLDVDDRLTAVRRAQRIGLLGGPDQVREIRSSRPVARVLPRRSLDGTPSARTRGARATTAEALRATEADQDASVVTVAVVREFDAKADKSRAPGNEAPRDSVIELEQAGDSAKAAAEADPGLGSVAREAVLAAHLAICVLKTEV